MVTPMKLLLTIQLIRLYTFDNGLTVYLSNNTDEPKIQTYMASGGSNYDLGMDGSLFRTYPI